MWPNERPYLLLTNDDGIDSPGLAAAVRAVADWAELLIVAPRFQQTGMGRAFPHETSTGIIEKTPLRIDGVAYNGFAVHGSPAQTVAHAVLEIAERKPDLCLSGINYGENLGTCVSCSGTLGAAFEADSHGIRSIAASLEINLNQQRLSSYPDADFNLATALLRRLAKNFFQKEWPTETSVLNVNIPAAANDSTETRITRQSRQSYFSFIKPQQRDTQKPFLLKSSLQVDLETLDPYSDVYAFHIDRVISLTPLSWDQTARNGWEFGNYKKLVK